MSRYTIPPKPSPALEAEVEEEFDTGDPPKTPEPSEQQDEECLYYYGEEGEEELQSYSGSTSEAQDIEWQDIDAESPEEPVESYPSRPSPPDDIGIYNMVIKSAATTYGVKL